MPSPRLIRIRFLAVICAAAALASAAAGWATGSLGSVLYEMNTSSSSFTPVIPQRIGGWVGTCSALIACVLWCRLIVPMSLHRIAGLRSSAALAGLVAGILAALLLHGALMVTEGRLRPDALAVGLGMGAPIGLVLGTIGGHLCRIAVTTERAFRLRPGRRIVPFDGRHEPDFMDQLDVRNNIPPDPGLRDDRDAHGQLG